MMFNGLNLDEVRQKLEQLAAPILEQAGIELVELSISLYMKEVALRLIIDLPQGGITVAQCSMVNRSLVEGIDANVILPEDGYSVEVSSPGLDRPLVNVKDFRRNLNKPIRFWLMEEQEGKKEHSGTLIAVDDKSLVVRLKKNKEIILPLEQVIKGLLVI